MQNAVIISLETAEFPTVVTNSHTIAAFRSLSPEVAEVARRVCKNSRIAQRYLAFPSLPKVAQPKQSKLSMCSGLQDRLEVARKIATRPLLVCAQRAIADAGISASDVGAIVLATNTVFGAPGLEYMLARELRLALNVKLTALNLMGCAAGLSALRVACNHVASLPDTMMNKYVLVVCLEVSSAHATFGQLNMNGVITHAIFGDGITCSIIGHPRSLAALRQGLLRVCEGESEFFSNTAEGIVLQITGETAKCLLDKNLSAHLFENLQRSTSKLLKQSEPKDFWCVHPGGRRILESVECALQLSRDQTDASWSVLSKYGNTLSCGVFYVLKWMIESKRIYPTQRGVALSFSPGVSMEVVAFEGMRRLGRE